MARSRAISAEDARLPSSATPPIRNIGKGAGLLPARQRPTAIMMTPMARTTGLGFRMASNERHN